MIEPNPFAYISCETRDKEIGLNNTSVNKSPVWHIESATNTKSSGSKEQTLLGVLSNVYVIRIIIVWVIEALVTLIWLFS